jgi:DNA-binding HxlR family transcriptional regulator
MSSRPIVVLLDLLGQRWTLRLLWELRDGALSFRALRDRADSVSPSVLNERLKALKVFGFVDAGPAGYALTPRGLELAGLVGTLNGHANGWAEADGGWPPRSAAEGAG